MMQNLISPHVSRLAEEVKVFKRNETEGNIYFLARRCAKDGIHEYNVTYHKNNDVYLLERFSCDCKFHALNPIDFKFCGYTYAVFQKLVKIGILRAELLCDDEAV